MEDAAEHITREDFFYAMVVTGVIKDSKGLELKINDAKEDLVLRAKIKVHVETGMSKEELEKLDALMADYYTFRKTEVALEEETENIKKEIGL